MGETEHYIVVIFDGIKDHVYKHIRGESCFEAMTRANALFQKDFPDHSGEKLEFTAARMAK